MTRYGIACTVDGGEQWFAGGLRLDSGWEPLLCRRADEAWWHSDRARAEAMVRSLVQIESEIGGRPRAWSVCPVPEAQP